MNFEVTSKNLEKLTGSTILIFGYKDQISRQEKSLDKITENKISKARESKDFTAKPCAIKVLDTETQFKRIVLVGLGKKSKADLDLLRKATSKAVKTLKHLPNKGLSLVLPKINRVSAQQISQAIAETIIMSGYTFTKFKTNKSKKAKLESVTLVTNTSKNLRQAKKGARAGQVLGESVNFARDLGNLPGNEATPSHLAKEAETLGKNHKNIKVQTFNEKQIKKEKMNALLAVARGTAEEPKFVILEYQPATKTGKKKKNVPTIVLAGKGITFDSGGISIKPSEKMEEMKYDMAGAAAVLGAIKAASETDLPIKIIGLVAATENLLSSRSMKPGDIITSRSGKTIEIINTDAEGRLILADTLDYAKQYDPDLVIDFATLTGAVVVALGDEQVGVFSSNYKASRQIQKSGENTGEGLTLMPLEKKYRSYMKSDFADLRNLSKVPYGGAITAALFLQEFTDYPWMHLDIAGVAWATKEKPYRPKGATGAGVRLIIDFLQNYKSIK